MSKSNGNHGTNGKQKAPKQSSRPCPICGQAVSPTVETFPFCTPRCRKIDLGKWLKEEYTISRPIEQSDLDEE